LKPQPKPMSLMAARRMRQQIGRLGRRNSNSRGVQLRAGLIRQFI
jgi:hypothetical protein